MVGCGLVVVKETSLPFLKRTEEVLHLLHPQVGVDVLVYTPAEFEQMSRERPFFQQAILSRSKGVV